MFLKSINLLLLLLVAVYQVSATASDIVCRPSCPIVHPQQHFCNADSAFKVTVTGVAYVNQHYQKVMHSESTNIRYQVQVVSVLKGGLQITEGTLIYFYSPTYTCSIPTLDREQEYLIAGKVRDGVIVITQCDGLSIRWSELTDEQRMGAEGAYQEQCSSCEIKSAGTAKYIGGELAELGEESGYWSTEGCFFNPIPSQKYGGKDCETLYSICESGLGGACSWQETEEYGACSQEREDTWFFATKVEPAFTCQSQCKAQPTKQLRYKCTKALKKLRKLGLC